MQLAPSYKRALITGGSSGLGKGLASFLKDKGIDVIAVGSSDFDLSKQSERSKLLEIITEKKPDLIINNAGFGLYGPSIEIPLNEQLKMIEVNIKALVEISIHSARTLKEASIVGTILNISSAGSFIPFPTFSVYCASKSFVNSFSLALDAELCDQGIRVLCACPGQIATNFRDRAAKGHPQKSDRRTMSVERAIKHLWKQIEEQKPLYIFDWKTRVMVWVARVLPRSFLRKRLMSSLKERYSFD